MQPIWSLIVVLIAMSACTEASSVRLRENQAEDEENGRDDDKSADEVDRTGLKESNAQLPSDGSDGSKNDPEPDSGGNPGGETPSPLPLVPSGISAIRENLSNLLQWTAPAAGSGHLGYLIVRRAGGGALLGIPPTGHHIKQVRRLAVIM